MVITLDLAGSAHQRLLYDLLLLIFAKLWSINLDLRCVSSG